MNPIATLLDPVGGKGRQQEQSHKLLVVGDDLKVEEHCVPLRFALSRLARGDFPVVSLPVH
jgi:hypothetical protein